ncbi:hypothetical protein Droror1_Dr00026849 [Drosera rotundifolia]
MALEFARARLHWWFEARSCGEDLTKHLVKVNVVGSKLWWLYSLRRGVRGWSCSCENIREFAGFE